MNPRTLVDVLSQWAREYRTRTAFTFLTDSGEQGTLTYGELDRQARCIAERLHRSGAPGERALLLYAPGLEFLSAFWGCLYAGVIAIPTFLPRNDRTLSQIAAIQKDAGARFALTAVATVSLLDEWSSTLFADQTMELITTDALPPEDALFQCSPTALASDLAYLQYTSGSTSAPKGVMVSHENVLVNLQLMADAWGTEPDDCHVTWTPHFHDMGLVLGLTFPLWLAQPCYMMAPATFAQRPERWLEAISQYRGTITNAPNFAYDLCAKSINQVDMGNLDLRCLRIVCNAAEPVRLDTVNKFRDTFSEAGLRSNAMYPSYGLAESTLIVTSLKETPADITSVNFDKAALATGRVQIRRDQGGMDHQELGTGDSGSLVACGAVTGDTRIEIVDPTTAKCCAFDEIGEVWIKGATVAQGYWQRPEMTATTFQARLADSGEGPFLRTGDLGFFHNKQLVITGRLKDLIIIHGRNIYPQDIEWTVQNSHAAIRPDAGAAFSLDIEGREELAIVQEIRRTHRRADMKPVIAAIRRAIWDEHQLAVYAIALVRPGTVPKTSSGKIQRKVCKSALLSRTLTLLHSDPVTILESGAIHPPTPFSSQRNHARVTPRTDFESKLFGLWQSVLCSAGDYDDIDVFESFFELGGDSLEIIRLAVAIQDTFGVSVAPVDLCRQPTIDGMSQVIVASKIRDVPPELLQSILNGYNNSHTNLVTDDESATPFIERE